MTTSLPSLLTLADLRVSYGKGRRLHEAVRSVTLEVGVGETVGLVGESGSGKSSIGRAILGLTPSSGGRIEFEGRDITRIGRHERQRLSQDLQVVFQDPRSSLNDAKRIGEILTEPLVANRAMTRKQARSRARDLMDAVGMPVDALDRFPGSFSGGQRQRVAIARALMTEPKLIVCDEPLSALDLSVQAQIINLLRRIQRETGVSYLFIGHDLAVVQLLSDRIAVMRQGQIVEVGPAEQVYFRPQHPYTQRLIAAEPYPDPKVQRERRAAWDRLTESGG